MSNVLIRTYIFKCIVWLSTYSDIFDFSNNLIVAQNGQRAMPDRSLFPCHLDPRIIGFVWLDVFVEPQGTPAMIDKDLAFEVGILVGVHYESCRLTESIDVSRMRTESLGS